MPKENKEKKVEAPQEQVNEAPAASSKGKKVVKTIEITAPKRTKQEKIALQNLLFGTSEKKLMVSDEFLNSMALKYISRRMKNINTAYENIHTTKLPAVFFKCCDEIEESLEELIILEPYYSFKNPVPSVYKRNYLKNKPTILTAMLNRIWKHTLQKMPLPDNIEDISDKAMLYYDETINSMLECQDKMSEEDLSLIDSFYKQVHGEEEDIFPQEAESPEEEPAEDSNEETEESAPPDEENT